MKRYRVSKDVAFPKEDGDWLSYNQVREMLAAMAWPYVYTDEELDEIIKIFEPKSKVW